MGKSAEKGPSFIYGQYKSPRILAEAGAFVFI